jgi:hypothetical protein
MSPRTHETCQKDRTEKIIFRVKPQMKSFVREFAEKQGLDISDFMRMMLEYFYMNYFVEGESYQDLRKKFFSMYPNNKEVNGAGNDK